VRRSSQRPSSQCEAGGFFVGVLLAAMALLSACDFPIVVNVETVAEEPAAGELFPLSGDYQLTMRTGLGELVFSSTAEFAVEAPSIAFTLQVLSAIECTGSQAPVGERYAVEAPVDRGLFTLDLPSMVLPGSSSPFACHEPELVGNLHLLGALGSSDALHGVFAARLDEPEEMTLSGPFTGARPAPVAMEVAPGED
jgi:hypothetical protein